MNDLLSDLSDAHGILLRRDAVANGVDDHMLGRLVRGGHLVRLRQGIYALRPRFLAADERERCLMLIHGVMRLYDDHVVLSHASACLVQGGPTWGLDLSRVHLTHLSGAGRRQSRVVHHRGECRVGDLRRVDEHWTTVPGRAVMETAATDGVEAGLVQANHFLHTGQTTPEELADFYEAQRHWPGTLSHHPVLHLADGRMESVGESRSDYLFWTAGLPRPIPQFEVFGPNGLLAGRVDFAWPEHKTMLEFDGLEKYHRMRRPGESIEAMVMREKRREDYLRELTGWIMIRLVWADLGLPRHTALRIRRGFELATTPGYGPAA